MLWSSCFVMFCWDAFSTVHLRLREVQKATSAVWLHWGPRDPSREASLLAFVTLVSSWPLSLTRYLNALRPAPFFFFFLFFRVEIGGARSRLYLEQIPLEGFYSFRTRLGHLFTGDIRY